jgi:hypothetical protein
MKAAGLVVDWSSALRANTVPDQCALRSFPYPNNLFPYRQNPGSLYPWKPKQSSSPLIPRESRAKSFALGLQLVTPILSKHIA